jgi:hypothetical protein
MTPFFKPRQRPATLPTVLQRPLPVLLLPGHEDRKNPTGYRERFVPADVLERQAEELYECIQLPPDWVQRLHEEMRAEFEYQCLVGGPGFEPGTVGL